MLAFYREVAVEGCSQNNGDMVLFQWGTHDWGAGPAFEIDITRQFIDMHPTDGDGEDDGDEQGRFSQLSLTYYVASSPELASLGTGNRWCKSTDELEDFVAYVHGTAPMRELGQACATRVEIDHDLV